MESFESNSDPRNYNLTADFIYIEKEWGSLFYKHFGKNNRMKAKQLCANEGTEVHLPIPRSPDENEFYRVFFGEENVWLSIIDDSNGIATDGFDWEARSSNKRQTIFVSRNNQEDNPKILHDWIPFKGSLEHNESYIKGIQLTKTGQWESIKETDEVNTVCIYNVIPNECLNCNDSYFCHYLNEKKHTECICKFDVEDPNNISNLINDGQQAQQLHHQLKNHEFNYDYFMGTSQWYELLNLNAYKDKLQNGLRQLNGYRRVNC